MKIMGQIKSRPTILSMIVTSFIMTSIVVMPIQSIAVAGEFSSHTVVPRESFSGVKMQQGGPQLDNDKKLDFGTSLKSVGQPGRDMQQRKKSYAAMTASTLKAARTAAPIARDDVTPEGELSQSPSFGANERPALVHSSLKRS